MAPLEGDKEDGEGVVEDSLLFGDEGGRAAHRPDGEGPLLGCAGVEGGGVKGVAGQS